MRLGSREIAKLDHSQLLRMAEDADAADELHSELAMAFDRANGDAAKLEALADRLFRDHRRSSSTIATGLYAIADRIRAGEAR